MAAVPEVTSGKGYFLDNPTKRQGASRRANEDSPPVSLAGKRTILRNRVPDGTPEICPVTEHRQRSGVTPRHACVFTLPGVDSVTVTIAGVDFKAVSFSILFVSPNSAFPQADGHSATAFGLLRRWALL
jgi:hypothetical protein